MAEAHSAVAFSFAITHDGWDVNFDREVLYLVWESGLRSWKKRLARFRVRCLLFWFMMQTLGFDYANNMNITHKFHIYHHFNK